MSVHIIRKPIEERNPIVRVSIEADKMARAVLKRLCGDAAKPVKPHIIRLG